MRIRFRCCFSTSALRRARLLPAIALGALACLFAPAGLAGTLRVCADPNNLPFSNSRSEGFENRIAALAAHDFGESIEYSYALQNARFIKHTLAGGKCDVIIGVAAGMDELATTHPYYASTYVFLSRKADRLAINSFADPRLRQLKIGVHLIGDESTPPALVLAREDIIDNVHGYMIEDDFSKPNPPARLVEAVADGEVDIASHKRLVPPWERADESP